jgi:hypothetical protein
MTSRRDWVILLIVIVAIAAAYFVIEGGDGAESVDDGGTLGSGSGASTGGLAGSILQALSNFENVLPAHNNPGGICGGYDASGNCTGPATFATLDSGVAAAEANISNYLLKDPAITVAQFVAKWSGGSGTVLQNYTNEVANALGLDPNDPIANAGGGGDDSDAGGDDADYGA